MYEFPQIVILITDKTFSSNFFFFFFFRMAGWAEEEGPQASTSYIEKEK